MTNENIDILKKVEELTAKVNETFGEKGRLFFVRHPLTLAILVVFGVTMVTEGSRLLLLEIPFLQNNPFTMLLIGLFVLIITGTLYTKLQK